MHERYSVALLRARALGGAAAKRLEPPRIASKRVARTNPNEPACTARFVRCALTVCEDNEL